MQKKIPQRQCMGCRERKAKRDMIRVVRGTDGTVSLTSAARRTAAAPTSAPIPNA